MTKEELLSMKVPPFRADLFRQIKENWNALAKPLDGLGTMETALCTIGAVQETAAPQLDPRALIILCADNGIVARGVSQSGQEVTLAVAKNMGKQASSVCRMAQACRTETVVVDIGIASDETIPGVSNRKVARGTRDFLAEPAMTEQETLEAVQIGVDLVRECRGRGIRLLATGEMGIGNTTTSAAVASALLALPAEVTAGRGAGLKDEGLVRKQQVIRAGLEKYGFADEGDGINGSRRAFEVLRCLGGLDIAGLCGVFIGGALYHVPVVVDGLISAAAALCADRLAPGTRQSMLASHIGAEAAMGYLLKELKLSPVIHAGLKLGEGTGAVMFLPMLDMAEAVYRGSSSFDDIGVAQYERYGHDPD